MFGVKGVGFEILGFRDFWVMMQHSRPRCCVIGCRDAGSGFGFRIQNLELKA